MAKYKISVDVKAYAYKTVATIECDSYEEYLELYKEIDNQQNFEPIETNASNDFEVDDTTLVDPIDKKLLKYYEEKKN